MKAEVAVDILNPGQVFACLGFLEAADELCEGAEGGFAWDESSNLRFMLRSESDVNPFEAVLAFLAEANIEDFSLNNHKQMKHGEEDKKTLPVCIKSGNQQAILDHWADESSRESFKLYAGNRSAKKILSDMVSGVRALWEKDKDSLISGPFGNCVAMGGSFNFDPRGAWTRMDLGYSPDKVSPKHKVMASPVVETLAAWGLQHARPDVRDGKSVVYGVWKGLTPPLLARPALAGSDVGLATRKFKFKFGWSGNNKIVQFATEEVE